MIDAKKYEELLFGALEKIIPRLPSSIADTDESLVEDLLNAETVVEIWDRINYLYNDYKQLHGAQWVAEREEWDHCAIILFRDCVSWYQVDAEVLLKRDLIDLYAVLENTHALVQIYNTSTDHNLEEAWSLYTNLIETPAI